jgi:type IV secretory pathway ATPase VirB11/archaellum biosynthesis ATPase
VERIRIMMASVPGMLGEILLHAIGQSADMASIATLTEDEDARSVAVRTRPHVVLMGGSPDRREDIVTALLSEVGNGCVVTLSGDGRTAVVHRVRALPLTLEGTSPEGLLEIVRLLVTS